MAWTETTRDHYRRDALRYASDLTDREWALVSPFLPKPHEDGATEKNEPSVGVRGDPVHRLDGLPMAGYSEGLPNLFDRPGLFLRVVPQRIVVAYQSHAGGGAAGLGWSRGQPARGGSR